MWVWCLVQVLVSSWNIEHWSISIKSAYSISNSSWFHKMSKNHLYLAIGIISPFEAPFKDKTVTEHQPPKRTIPRMWWLTLAMLSNDLRSEQWRPPWGRRGSFAPQLGGSTPLRPRMGGLFLYANTVPHRSGIEANGSLYTPSSLHPSKRLLMETK